MIWVCRAGVNSIYFRTFLEDKKIYLPWDGFKIDLSLCSNREQIKDIVRKEKGDVSSASISNWSGQLYSFSKEMAIGDYALIPSKGSQTYMFASINGEYNYDPQNVNKLWHSHSIKLLVTNIPRTIFSQSLQYSLGAYRTVFKIKKESELLLTIKKYKSQH